eukprot:6198357-Pleurochrysis_carterae.AAC.2
MQWRAIAQPAQRAVRALVHRPSLGKEAGGASERSHRLDGVGSEHDVMREVKWRQDERCRRAAPAEHAHDRARRERIMVEVGLREGRRVARSVH